MMKINGRYPFALVSLEDVSKHIFATPVAGATDECELGYELTVGSSTNGKFRVVGTNIMINRDLFIRNGEGLVVKEGVISPA